MTKCWGREKARRTRRTKGKKKVGGYAYSGGDYKTKSKKGHTWKVDRDRRGNPILRSRRCKDCGIKPPGKGRAEGEKRWKSPNDVSNAER